MDGGEPDIPVYKIIECKGPTNTRVYTVAVYFRGERLAKAHGHSIQQAEMNAAKLALETCAHQFPHLNYQRRIMENSFKRQGVVTDTIRETWYQETIKKRLELGLDRPDDDQKPEREETEKEILEEVEQTSPADMDLADEEETPPIPPIVQSEPEVRASTSDHGPSGSGTSKKAGQQEAVRAEIREIEEKLQRKKQKKVSTAKKGEIEDGECIDSEEDEEPAVKVQEVKAPEEVKDKHREDQRKRWCDDRKTSERRDKSHSSSRGSREESYYRYERRDRERPPPPSRRPHYEYDHRQSRY